MAGPSGVAATGFLLGRGLLALVLAYLAVGNLRDRSESVGYARSKGVPVAGVAVPVGSLTLLAGSVSLFAGVYPLIGALAVASFLVPVTALMHDFWNADGQTADDERVHFLKNVGLLGGTLVVAALSAADWSYLGVTL